MGQEEALLTPRVYQPRSLHEAWELKSSLGSGALYVSGGTLLRTQWEAGTAPMPKHLIDLRKVEEIGGISFTEMNITLGALVTLAQCRKDRQLQAVAPAIREGMRVIAAPAVRNLATLGGNIASGYGDILPALLVHDAEIVTYDGRFLSVQLLKSWLDERWEGTRPHGDLIAGIRLAPAAPENPELRQFEVFRKVGRREAFTASLVTVAVSATIGPGNLISGVRIAAGGGSGRPRRLEAAEALLEGAVYEESMLSPLYEAVANHFASYSDPFATEAYKKKTAGNLIVSEIWKAMR